MKNFRLIDHIHTAVAVIDKDMTVVDANESFQHRSNSNKKAISGTKCFVSAYKLNEACSVKTGGTCPVSESFKTKNRHRLFTTCG